MRLDGILNLWACEITGVLRLDQAKVTGQLCLRDAIIGDAAGPGDGEAVAAFGLTVDGGVECTALTTHGSFGMQVATITGGLDLHDARISCPGQWALLVDRGVIGGRLDGDGLRVEGGTRMYNTHIGASLVLRAATLLDPGRLALGGGGLTVAGGVFLTEGFSAEGEVSLIGAELSANLSLRGAVLSNPDGTALELANASVGVCHAPGLSCTGQANLTGVRIAGDLDLRDAHFTGNVSGPVLSAEGASVGGALILAGVRTQGEVGLRTVQVGQRVLLMGAQLNNPGGVALRLSRAQVSADVFWRRAGRRRADPGRRSDDRRRAQPQTGADQRPSGHRAGSRWPARGRAVAAHCGTGAGPGRSPARADRHPARRFRHAGPPSSASTG